METLPVSIRRLGGAVVINWSDGAELHYRAAALRKACPCATCRERRTGEQSAKSPQTLPVLSASEARPLEISHMRPVGNYAYNITFSDGHDSGIFTFEFLRSLGQPQSAI